MNEPSDPLETELRAFRPIAVSPGLRRGIAERLATPPTQPRSRLGRIARIGSLAAAVLAALVLVAERGRGPGPVVENIEPRTPAQAPAPAPAPNPTLATPLESPQEALPSLHAYRRALARSTQDLEALLDRHAVQASGPALPLVRVSAFSRPDLAAQALAGEL